MRMMSFVASICACSEARFTAATTTLEVSVRYVASSWKRCTSASASFDSTWRRTPPNTSGE
jgi:hypothetical protein